MGHCKYWRNNKEIIVDIIVNQELYLNDKENIWYVL